MQHSFQFLYFSALLLSASWAFASGSGDPQTSAQAGHAPVDAAAVPTDVIARVGDQNITFNQINTMLNSSAVVGVSVPALGTPQRDTARIVVLDKVISANLLYLDAVRKGLDDDPAYRRAMQSFADGMLGSQYHRRMVASELSVSDQEIETFVDANIQAGTEVTDDLRIVIEASLRKHKLQQRMAEHKAKLRQGIRVEVYPDRLAPADGKQADDVVVAKYGDQAVTWGDVKDTLLAASRGALDLDPLAWETDAQLAALQVVIDKRIIADKARAAGLEYDPVYLARYDEFKKTKLVNMHRAKLARQMEPSEAQLKSYYQANRNTIMQVEKRKLQEVLFSSREQALIFKDKIAAGEMTLFEVAAQHSLAPGANQNLGEVGWVAQGRAQPALDEVIFKLEPGEIGGPVKSTEGWHLFKVLDVADARYDDFNDKQTRKRSRRRYIHEQLDHYVQDLRKNAFKVEVFQHNLIRLAQLEADMVERLAEKAQQPGSLTEQRIEAMSQTLKP